MMIYVRMFIFFGQELEQEEEFEALCGNSRVWPMMWRGWEAKTVEDRKTGILVQDLKFKEESADWQRLSSSEVYCHQRLPGTRGEPDSGVSSLARKTTEKETKTCWTQAELQHFVAILDFLLLEIAKDVASIFCHLCALPDPEPCGRQGAHAKD